MFGPGRQGLNVIAMTTRRDFESDGRWGGIDLGLNSLVDLETKAGRGNASESIKGRLALSSDRTDRGPGFGHSGMEGASAMQPTEGQGSEPKSRKSRVNKSPKPQE